MQSLSKKDSLLYAPLSNVGAVSFDKDAVYIDIGRVNFTKKENLAIANGDEDEEKEESSDSDTDEDENAPASLLKSLQDVRLGVDEKMKKSSLRIFKGSKAIHVESDESSGDDSDDNIDTENLKKVRNSRAEIEKLVKPFRQDISMDTDSESGSDSNDHDDDSDEDSISDEENPDEEDSDDDDSVKGNNDIENTTTSATWKTNLAQKAAEAYMGREIGFINLQELVYGKPTANVMDDTDESEEKSEKDDGSDSDEEFFKIKKSGSSGLDRNQSHNSENMPQLLGEEDSSRAVLGESMFNLSVWLEEGEDCLIESIRDKFVTGNWDNQGKDPNDDEEAFGDFEDLETGEKFGPNGEIDSDDDDDEDKEGLTDAKIRELNSRKKMGKKADFDEEYDDEKKGAISSTNPGDENAENEYLDSLKRAKEARLKKNKEEFGEDGESNRLRLEGFRQGLYCRIRIDGVPAEFIECFDANKPVILGGLTPQETNRGLIRCRFKKHRWHKKILKCNDPLIFSVGWRRFQSIPVFSTEDQNRRHR